jgi:hypothetical protein
MIFPKCVYKFVDDNLGMVLLMIIGFSLAAFIFGVEYLAKRQCETYSAVTGKQTNYIAWSECYIKVNGEWLTYKERLNTLIARDVISE